MIGIFDSGIGGLSVLREIYRLLPEENYIYYADSAHCPYGEKSREYVTDRARTISEFLIKEGAGIIVVACNTATAAAISSLRKDYSYCPSGTGRVMEISGGRYGHVSFIGMGTLNGLKYKTTREMWAKGIKVVEHVGKGFVNLVEQGITDGPEAERTVEESVRPLVDAGADTIVLGCTHYPFLADTIQKVAGPDVNLIDPAPAVARHLLDVMGEEGLLSGEKGGKPEIRLMSSGDSRVLRMLAGRLGIPGTQFCPTCP